MEKYKLAGRDRRRPCVGQPAASQSRPKQKDGEIGALLCTGHIRTKGTMRTKVSENLPTHPHATCYPGAPWVGRKQILSRFPGRSVQSEKVSSPCRF